MSELKGKDGIVRNFAKIQIERKRIAEECKEHYKRLYKNPLDPHALTNIYVEEARVSPYYVGHREVIKDVVLFIAGAYSWVQIFGTM